MQIRFQLSSSSSPLSPLVVVSRSDSLDTFDSSVLELEDTEPLYEEVSLGNDGFEPDSESVIVEAAMTVGISRSLGGCENSKSLPSSSSLSIRMVDPGGRLGVSKTGRWGCVNGGSGDGSGAGRRIIGCAGAVSSDPIAADGGEVEGDGVRGGRACGPKLLLLR